MSSRKRMGHSICMDAAPGAGWELPPPEPAELIQVFVRDVAQLDTLSKLLGTQSDGSSLRSSIAELRHNLTQQSTAIMKAIQSNNDPSEKLKQERIVASFRAAVEQYQRIANVCTETERRYPIQSQESSYNNYSGNNNYSNNYNNNNNGMLPEDFQNDRDEFSLLDGGGSRENGRSNNYYDQQITFDPNKLVFYDDHDAAIIEERNEEIRQIAQDMVGLQEIYQEVGTTVQEQAPALEHAETQVHVAQETAVEATHEIAKAGKLKKGKFMAKGAAGGAVAGAVAGAAAGTVLGPIGTLAGAAIGGAIGGLMGAGGGKKVAEKQQSQIDQELFYHEISNRWQPDEEVTHCRSCAKEFTPIRRKHHCRRCGYIYCRKCTDFKTKVTTNSIEFDREVRVCINCFYGRPVPPAAQTPSQPKTNYSPQPSFSQPQTQPRTHSPQPSFSQSQPIQPQLSQSRPLQTQSSQPQLSQSRPLQTQHSQPQLSYSDQGPYGPPSQQYLPQQSFSAQQQQGGAPMYNNNYGSQPNNYHN